jgi:hypothetical protein
MRRVLLIFLSLVLALAGGSMVGAEDGFYVIPGMKGKYAPVPKTGQTQSYRKADDGFYQKGVAWPIPRFTDNNNGTVTDNLTKLIWTKNADLFGPRTWIQALSDAMGLYDTHVPGGPLSDGSKAGDWRLPNIKELWSLVDDGTTSGLTAGHPFTNVSEWSYWSSTTVAPDTTRAWIARLGTGNQIYDGGGDKLIHHYVWCVRGGNVESAPTVAPFLQTPVVSGTNIPLTWTYSGWPSSPTSGEGYRLEESTSPLGGFTEIAQIPGRQTPQSYTRTSTPGTY